MIDHGTIIAEGTADELKERTGATYCEIVPRHLNDLPAMAEALSSLLPAGEPGGADAGIRPHRDARARRPEHPGAALSHLDAANIELLDIALRRPSLDEVFLALTTDSIGHTSATRPGQPVRAGQWPNGRRSAPGTCKRSSVPLDAEALT